MEPPELVVATAVGERRVFQFQILRGDDGERSGRLATAIPMSTAYGKLGRLVEQGFLVRTAPSRDRRRIGLKLTPATLAALDAIMDQLG